MRIALVLAALCAIPSIASAKEAGPRPFGLGLMIGSPTGLTGKLYLGRPFAIQMGAGWIENYGRDGGQLQVDVVWHPAVLANTADFALPFYFGVGGRVLDHNEDCWYYRGDRFCGGTDDTHIGVRVPVGILMDFKKVPMDLYLELALVVDVIYIEPSDYHEDHDHTSINGVIGGRYYF